MRFLQFPHQFSQSNSRKVEYVIKGLPHWPDKIILKSFSCVTLSTLFSVSLLSSEYRSEMLSLWFIEY
ncbi:hypothetical protein Anas_10441 [Armadillidium nasatum]|uniref:Uncharacterized protein n=1 Tax=Armadillidium nasatum TaxID=96803 RepID=A0A5N5THV1_9CRUS|nr:hypothetical protein Anas_10441 [Armadillidium nasatum]